MSVQMTTHSSTLAGGISHGQISLVGYSPWGCKELDMAEQLHFHFLVWQHHNAYQTVSLNTYYIFKTYTNTL